METLNDTQLKRKIMRRIYFIFFCKKALSKRALKIYVSLVLVVGLLSTVSVSNVFSNMFRKGLDLGGISYFSKYAFMHTELLVQSIVVFLGLFVLYLLSDMSRNHFFLQRQREA